MAAYLIGEIDMITCKEDLIGTEFKITCKEEADLLKSKCELFGIKHATWSCCQYSDGVMRGVIGKDLGTHHSCKLLFTKKQEGIDSMDEFRALKLVSIKDLKPKPTKFVKVEESIFDLKEEFEKGELYVSTCEGHYTQILGEKGLFLAAFNNSIYRQVEIDWTDELGSFLAKKAFDGASVNNLDISDLNDNLGTVSVNLELRFNDFIEMCHKVAELTDKPE